MSYEHLFQRYGSPSTEAEIRLTGYLLRPDKLKEDQIKRNDETAARLILECERTAETLREYRQALASRYAALNTMPYQERLEIERYRSYRGNLVTYYVRIVRTYEDGTQAKTLSETYPGKERRKAISRFEELKRQRPGIEVLEDISPQSWEK